MIPQRYSDWCTSLATPQRYHDPVRRWRHPCAILIGVRYRRCDKVILVGARRWQRPNNLQIDLSLRRRPMVILIDVRRRRRTKRYHGRSMSSE